MKKFRDLEQMDKFPIGISTLEKIRTTKYYVDKTEHVARMVGRGDYYFLSRPRRFGKSLLIDTLKQAFLGQKELFKGLYLEHNWDWDKQYPVIHISFASNEIAKDIGRLEQKIYSILEVNAQEYGLTINQNHSYSIQFDSLIRLLYKKTNNPVVILIDEYDKPILDVIVDSSLAAEMRNVLCGLYGVIKDNDDKIKFVLLTGVSRFSKTGIFSGLNNLNDITYDQAYAAVCGYTQTELENTFSDYLIPEDLPGIKEWYNGYNFIGHEGVYNPFSILNFFTKNKHYDNYWFSSGTPRFLIELLMKRRYYLPNLSNTTLMMDLLDSFDVERIDLSLLMLQTGYLTVAKYYASPLNPDKYFVDLKVPNAEVAISLQSHILQYIYSGGAENLSNYNAAFSQGFLQNNPALFEGALATVFASIPYNWYTNNDMAHYEGFYCSLLYAFTIGMGYHVIAEDVTSKGRIDLTLIVQNKAYIFELKVNKTTNQDASTITPNAALQQLRDRNYAQKYTKIHEKVYLIGMEFNEQERNIISFQYEEVTFLI